MINKNVIFLFISIIVIVLFISILLIFINEEFWARTRYANINEKIYSGQLRK